MKILIFLILLSIVSCQENHSHSELERRIEDLESELEHYKEMNGIDIEFLEDASSNLESSVFSLESDILFLPGDISDIEYELEEHTSLLDEHFISIENIGGTFYELELRVDSLKYQIDEIESNQSYLESRIENIEYWIASVK